MALIIPALICIACYYGIGGRIKGLKLGIVNEEVKSPSECLSQKLPVMNLSTNDCDLQKLSCTFLSGFDDSDFIKV